MQCYTIENLVKEDFALHRSSAEGCTESIKDKSLTSVLQIWRGLAEMQYLGDFLTIWNQILWTASYYS